MQTLSCPFFLNPTSLSIWADHIHYLWTNHNDGDIDMHLYLQGRAFQIPRHMWHMWARHHYIVLRCACTCASMRAIIAASRHAVIRVHRAPCRLKRKQFTGIPHVRVGLFPFSDRPATPVISPATVLACDRGCHFPHVDREKKKKKGRPGPLKSIDYISEDGRFLASANCVAISKSNSLSNI